MNVSTEYTTIAPHGGELVDRRAPEDQRDELLSRAEDFARVTLGPCVRMSVALLKSGCGIGWYLGNYRLTRWRSVIMLLPSRAESKAGRSPAKKVRPAFHLTNDPKAARTKQ